MPNHAPLELTTTDEERGYQPPLIVADRSLTSFINSRLSEVDTGAPSPSRTEADDSGGDVTTKIEPYAVCTVGTQPHASAACQSPHFGILQSMEQSTLAELLL